MKNVLLFLCIFSISSIFAFENSYQSVLRVLNDAKISISELELNGHRLLWGEFTGAGRLPVKKIFAFITKSEIIFRNQIKEIVFLNNRQVLENIKYIVLDDRVVDLKKIRAFIVD